MASDLVERLRRSATSQDMLTCEDMLQAADEIERLRNDVERLQDAMRQLRRRVYEQAG